MSLEWHCSEVFLPTAVNKKAHIFGPFQSGIKIPKEHFFGSFIMQTLPF